MIFHLFTDASVSAKTQEGIGGFFGLASDELDSCKNIEESQLKDMVGNKIQFCRFHSNKCTFVEIKTAILAIHHILETKPEIQHFNVYTDCQSLFDLVNGRLKKLAGVDYMTKSGKVLGHADLYRELFLLSEKIKISVFKIKGHSSNRVTVEEKIFSAVDKLVREELRSHL